MHAHELLHCPSVVRGIVIILILRRGPCPTSTGIQDIQSEPPSFVDMMVLYCLDILPPLTHYCLQQILSLFQICQQFCLLCFHLLLLQPFQCLHINLVPFVHGSAKRAVYKHYTQIAQITEICHFLEKIIYIKT